MSDFKIIETQEQLNSIVADRLARERKKIEAEYAEKISSNDDLKKENESLKERLAGYEGKKIVDPEEWEKTNNELARYESDSVKTRIAKEFNLPEELASRLTGDDEEALKKDAEDLSSLVSQNSTIQTIPLGDTEATINTKDSAIKNMVSEMIEKGE